MRRRYDDDDEKYAESVTLRNKRRLSAVTSGGSAQATVMPIERAAPSTMRSAPSTLVALRSFILVWAISRNCALVICPTLALFGVAEPLSTPAAFLSRSEVG